ncbi:MAG: hypothetical protein CMC55_00380 [Flavobacteriaceae bacterium]|nr:hypothetical protein [Flavobacteriaceae bacterium]
MKLFLNTTDLNNPKIEITKKITKMVKNPNDKSQTLIQREKETDTFIVDKNEWGLWDVSVIDIGGNTCSLTSKKSKKEAIQFVELF